MFESSFTRFFVPFENALEKMEKSFSMIVEMGKKLFKNVSERINIILVFKYKPSDLIKYFFPDDWNPWQYKLFWSSLNSYEIFIKLSWKINKENSTSFQLQFNWIKSIWRWSKHSGFPIFLFKSICSIKIRA